MTRLDEIRARLEAATPGPWEAYHARFPNAYGEGFWRVDGPHERGYEGGFERADADLIAHAPEDLRLLLTVAEAAKEVRERACPPHCDEIWRALDALDESSS